MKESEPLRHYHLEALHHLVGMPFQEELGIRRNKEKILEQYGFSKGTNIALKKEFFLPELDNEKYEIRDYLIGQLESGRFVSMLFKVDRWEAIGGSPVVYIMTQEDLDTKLTFESDKLKMARAHDGNLVTIDHPIILQTYSRRKSLTSELTGFVNYENLTRVGLGGGFRLQVDNLACINGQLCLLISAYFSFNDMGSRVLALSCREDELVPRFNTSFLLQVNENQLIYPGGGETDNKSLSSIKEVDTIIDKVLSSLFRVDGAPINKIIRDLLSVRPSMGVHQLEGIFSIPSENEISAEVIDFDGLDVFDLGGQQKVNLSPSERLARGQLNASGFLSTDPECLLPFVYLQSRIKDSLKKVANSPVITEDIKRETYKHFLNFPELFSRNLTGAVKLARLLRNIDVKWENTETPQIKRFYKKDDTLILISIEGFEIAFWTNGNNLVDCSDIKRLSRKLSQVTSKEIVGAHFLSIKEGD